MKELTQLQADWAAHWPAALAVWSRFAQLREPRWCLTQEDEKREHLSGSFAMIRLDDHAIVISLRQIQQLKLQQFHREIMAHEIGHHILCPADLADHGRTIARMRMALPTKEHLAGFIANLYTDLLINDRLQRTAGLNMAGVYQALDSKSHDDLWKLYLRIYEILWSLPKGTLAHGEWSRSLEGDAVLGARLVRAYAKDWLNGAGRFAALCLPYLLKDEATTARQIIAPWLDTNNAGSGGLPAGLTEIDPAEAEGAIHPSLDKNLTHGAAGGGSDGVNKAGGKRPPTTARDPRDYAEILKAAGVELSENEIAINYYRERALPHLIRFPVRTIPESTEPLPEGLATWEFGDSIGDLDPLQSVLTSPHVVPGVTTVQRVFGTSSGTLPEKQPIDLFLGVDCSGSMVNPQRALSYPVLAGAIIALSALRAGAKVMVMLSGEPGSTVATEGFVSDERSVLGMLTNYLGTGTTFGIPHLKKVFQERKPSQRRAHILIVTDHDIFGMLGRDGGWEIARMALVQARGGGTYVLHMHRSTAQAEVEHMKHDGWDVHHVHEWSDILAFARAFAAKTYKETGARA
jgi:hypothetical protein